MSEEDAGGELTVDHYNPAVAGGTDAYENLVYACFRCNGYKGEYHPSSGDLAFGRRVLHPLVDDLHDHLDLNESTGVLVPRTETGRFHLALLHLNRPALVAYRIRKCMISLLETKQLLLEAEIQSLRALVGQQNLYVVELRRLLGLPAHGEEYP